VHSAAIDLLRKKILEDLDAVSEDAKRRDPRRE